jgi:hypothetical protein
MFDPVSKRAAMHAPPDGPNHTTIALERDEIDGYN